MNNLNSFLFAISVLWVACMIYLICIATHFIAKFW